MPLPARRPNVYLVAETLGVFVLLSAASVLLHRAGAPLWLQLPVLLFQGLWFYRFYIVGHEAAHKKLFPHSKKANDFWGCAVLLPLMTPINIYRKIHYFHHGFNRADHHTSALDTFVTRRPLTPLRRAWYYGLWYISIFGGGLFIHSLVSVVLFLAMPVAVSIRISPAFKGWTIRDQGRAILIFALGLGLHLGVYFLGGRDVYLYSLGYPMLVFAWLLSLLVYIFHYDTTTGPQTRYHVRSTRPVPVLSWVLMNFNEHATHHQYPNIPWYELPQKRAPLPAEFHARNQPTGSFLRAVLQQLKGPTIIYAPKHHEAAPRPA